MTDEDDDWRFAVDDVGDTENPEGDSNGERTDLDERNATDASEGAGERDERPPLEPGSPSLENVLFVLLGVFVTLFVIARLAVVVIG